MSLKSRFFKSKIDKATGIFTRTMAELTKINEDIAMHIVNKREKISKLENEVDGCLDMLEKNNSTIQKIGAIIN